MALTWSDICKVVFAIILPPVGVFLERGFGADLCINILLTILGYVPDLIKAAKDTQLYVLDALKLTNASDIEKMIGMFDDISDKMCTVTDSAECIRRLHSSDKWRQAADEAFGTVSALMNELNSDRKLMGRFNSTPEYNGPDRELVAVIKSFKLDFDLFKSCSEREIHQLKRLQESVQAAEQEYESRQEMSSLERMVKQRFEFAKAVGFKNPLEIVLRDKQLNSSEAVHLFLKTASRGANTEELFGIDVEIAPFHDLGGKISFQFLIKDTQGKLIGQVMFDISCRSNKDPHPTHYTIRCRQPACVLISVGIEDLEKISWHQSSSLFHEYGHALHSVLSETKYQMLSGSRGPVDLVEIPSTLMEIVHQSANQQNQIGKGGFIQVPVERIKKEETFQVEIATFDQLIHSVEPGAISWTRDIANSIKSDGDWFCRIPHLATYGGTYFSYIYSKNVAETIWNRITQDKTLTFDAFKSEFLCRGGTASLDFINKQPF